MNKRSDLPSGARARCALLAALLVFALTSAVFPAASAPGYGAAARETLRSVSCAAAAQDALIYALTPEPAPAGEALPPRYGLDRLNQTPVRNQGSSGLCWAFASYAALEANMKKSGMGEQDFSELHMGYSMCSYFYDGQWVNAEQGSFTSLGDSGSRYEAASYLTRGTSLSGIVNESDDPYVDDLSVYRPLSETESKPKSYTARNILFLNGAKDNGDGERIKAAVMRYGAVAACLYFVPETSAKRCYDPETAAYCYTGAWNGSTNHLAVIVGWNDSYPRESFPAQSRPRHDGAWLVKNSWGESWGIGGYFWISYEDQSFPSYAYAFDGAEVYDASRTVYEHGYKYNGCVSPEYGSSNDAVTYYAQVFTAQSANELVTRVRFFACAPATYELSVIPGYTPPASNCGALATGAFSPGEATLFTAPCPGWYTVDLEHPAALREAGEAFAVLVGIRSRWDSARREYLHIPMACEDYDRTDLYRNRIKGVTARPGTSFYVPDGTRYVESDKVYCIKALTIPMPENG